MLVSDVMGFAVRLGASLAYSTDDFAWATNPLSKYFTDKDEGYLLVSAYYDENKNTKNWTHIFVHPMKISEDFNEGSGLVVMLTSPEWRVGYNLMADKVHCQKFKKPVKELEPNELYCLVNGKKIDLAKKLASNK